MEEINTDFMNLKEAAQFLRVSTSVIYQLNARKKIPCRKIGRKIIFSRSELTAWVMNGGASVKGE